MNKKLIFLGMLVVLLALSLAFVSCGGTSLVGTWGDNEATLVLLKKGTGAWYGDTLTWKTEKKRLMITWQGELYTYEYNLSGSTLILTDVGGNDGGTTYTYIKK